MLGLSDEMALCGLRPRRLATLAAQSALPQVLAGHVGSEVNAPPASPRAACSKARCLGRTKPVAFLSSSLMAAPSTARWMCERSAERGSGHSQLMRSAVAGAASHSSSLRACRIQFDCVHVHEMRDECSCAFLFM